METGARVWTIKDGYRLGDDIQSKVLAFAFGLASEIERQLISDRTKNSLQRLKDEGKHLGRPFAFGLSAEIERNLISQRTKEALERKKSEGMILGRPK